MPHGSRTKPVSQITYGVAAAPFGALPNGRKRLCGAWTLLGARCVQTLCNPKARKFVRLLCKCWACSLCGPRKAGKYRAQILRAVSRGRLTRMVTLTVDVHKMATGEDLRTFIEHFEAHRAIQTACRCSTCTRVQVNSIAHIRGCWSKLRVYLHRRYGRAPKYIAILEFQKVTGLAHLHIVIDRYMEQAWVKQAWQAVGGGQHVDIRQIDAHRAAAYLSKYLSKDMFLSAPSGMRRVTTSRSIRLDEKKPSEYHWQVIKAQIDRCFVAFRESATDVLLNEGEMQSFFVRD
jgi:hypothetical protein